MASTSKGRRAGVGRSGAGPTKRIDRDAGKVWEKWVGTPEAAAVIEDAGQHAGRGQENRVKSGEGVRVVCGFSHAYMMRNWREWEGLGTRYFDLRAGLPNSNQEHALAVKAILRDAGERITAILEANVGWADQERREGREIPNERYGARFSRYYDGDPR